MPEDLHRSLSKAADAAGHSLGEEIRRRLDRSFSLSTDAETGQLLEQIAAAAKLIGRYWSRPQPVGSFSAGGDPLDTPLTPALWHADPQAFAVFMAAVNILATRQKPAETPGGDGGVMFDGTPEEAGARLAIMVDLTLLGQNV
jgi:hypothetical protein